MKSTTIQRYETRDGKHFDDEMAARLHEIQATIDTVREDDSQRLTAAELQRLMAYNPEVFSETLGLFMEDEE